MPPVLAGLADIVLMPGAPAALAVGVIVGLIVGLMPGISARTTLPVAIPFAMSLPPTVAAVLLVAIHASSQVSSTVPAVLFGAPTSASEAATTLDGYPLARDGHGSRAIGAIISASAIGGVGGALVLLGFGALASQWVTHIGSPEIATLAAGGILAIALISDGSLPAGIALGAAGVLVSTVGVGHFGLAPRFTFGRDELFDGVVTAAVIVGIMAIPELLRERDRSPALKLKPRYADVIQGMIDPLRHGWLTFRSSLIGLIVGIIPGIGLSVAVWLSYGHASRSTRPRAAAFGEGAIEGVVAPEAASGAKEGGALIPTLFLGLPGSSGMAILLAAFSIVGVAVGPAMMSRQPEMPSAIAGTVALANVIGMLICFAAAPWMLRLVAMPQRIVVTLALGSAIVATYFSARQPVTAIEIMAFSGFGMLLAWSGLSRPAFLIGFVIGPMFEASVLRSATIQGWSAFARPGVIGIIVAFVAIAFLLRSGSSGMPVASKATPRRAALPLGLMGLMFGAAILLAPAYGQMSSMVPIAAGSIGLVACAWGILSAIRENGAVRAYRIDPIVTGAIVAALIATALFGTPGLWLILLILVAPVSRQSRRKAA